MLRRSTAFSLIVFILSTAPAPGATLTIVALDGPHAYTGGVPSLTNGGVGINASGGGLPPSAGGPGITVEQGCTARIGVVVELRDGVPNQLSIANIYFTGAPSGSPGAVDLAGVVHTATNAGGNLWNRCQFTTGMDHWIAGATGGGQPTLTGGGPAPFVENFHVLADDSSGLGGGSGNTFDQPNATFLLTEIVVHGVGPVGAEARVNFDVAPGATFLASDAFTPFTFQNADPPPAGAFNGLGRWWARNGRLATNAFPIEIIDPCNVTDVGGCCLQDGCAEAIASDECALLGGSFLGADVACFPGACGDGACCIADMCEIVPEDRCLAFGGVFHGVGAACQPTTCESIGACCLPDASACVYRDEVTCTALGGSFLGIGEVCVGAQTVLVPDHSAPNPALWTHTIQTIAPGTCDNLRGVEPACVNSPVKFDAWITWVGGTSCHDFGQPDAVPLPAGFFGPGSDPFTGTICFVGEPLGITPWGDFGSADTIVRRYGDPFTRFAPVSPTPATVDIEIVALNLVSTAPINVTYNGGTNPEPWSVRVDLSAVHTDANPSNDPPLGSLTAVKSHCNGGTYSSFVSVQPRFTFAKVSNPGETHVFDTGLAGQPPVTMTMDEDHWVMDPDPLLLTSNPVCSNFRPGLQENEPTTDCLGACCRESGCTQETAACAFVCNVYDHAPPTFLGCFGDIDGNGVVNAGDRGFVSANIGATDRILVCRHDIDGNGVVNAGDRGFVSANIGQCVDLPDYQNGSGLNHGVPDTRFDNGSFLGIGSSCDQCP